MLKPENQEHDQAHEGGHDEAASDPALHAGDAEPLRPEECPVELDLPKIVGIVDVNAKRPPVFGDRLARGGVRHLLDEGTGDRAVMADLAQFASSLSYWLTYVGADDGMAHGEVCFDAW